MDCRDGGEKAGKEVERYCVRVHNSGYVEMNPSLGEHPCYLGRFDVFKSSGGQLSTLTCVEGYSIDQKW